MFKINPEKNEILRYLGYKGQKIDDSIYKTIDECIQEIKEISRYRYTYRIFDIKIGMHKGFSCIDVLGTNLKFVGNDIYEHLRDCKKCAVMAVTLGVEVDNAIRNLQNSDMVKALVMDACATEYIEKVCDSVEDEIKAVAERDNYGTNFRFSPGYGDFPIDIQSGIAGVLDATKRIGLTVTDNSIMIPGKSVTAVLGFTFSRAKNKERSSCDICSMRENCMFRKGGTTCGRGRTHKA